MQTKLIRYLWTRFRLFVVTVILLIGIALNIYALSQFAKDKTNISQPPSNSAPKLKDQPSPTKSFPSEELLTRKTNQALSGEPKLGHFPFAEGDSSKMLIIASYGPDEYQRFERLAPDATLALHKLIYAARFEGVWIIPVSGFRSIADQEKLFEAQIQKLGSQEAAAKLSAPPGYSEHHTGYAIDLADGHFPRQDITYNFATTEAFKWLNIHGKEFGFELSFPENNLQGVSYEPWHWRFIGTPQALEIFKARNQ